MDFIGYLLNACSQTHAGSNELRSVGLLPVQLRVEQQKLHHTVCTISSVGMPLNICTQHGYDTRASVCSCIAP